MQGPAGEREGGGGVEGRKRSKAEIGGCRSGEEVGGQEEVRESHFFRRGGRAKVMSRVHCLPAGFDIERRRRRCFYNVDPPRRAGGPGF